MKERHGVGKWAYDLRFKNKEIEEVKKDCEWIDYIAANTGKDSLTPTMINHLSKNASDMSAASNFEILPLCPCSVSSWLILWRTSQYCNLTTTGNENTRKWQQDPEPAIIVITSRQKTQNRIRKCFLLPILFQYRHHHRWFPCQYMMPGGSGVHEGKAARRLCLRPIMLTVLFAHTCVL